MNSLFQSLVFRDFFYLFRTLKNYKVFYYSTKLQLWMDSVIVIHSGSAVLLTFLTKNARIRIQAFVALVFL